MTEKVGGWQIVRVDGQVDLRAGVGDRYFIEKQVVLYQM